MPAYPPGTSGNPAGRPKGARGIAQELMKEVSRAGDGPEQMSRLQQLLRVLVDKAVKGDNRAIEKVLERVEALDAKFEAARNRGFAFTESDRETIAEIWRRLTADGEGP